MAEHEHAHHGGGGLTKKMGPLPVWAWGVILGVAAYFLYERYKNNSSASSAATNAAGTAAGVLDPNAIDPNTGLTYGEEEAAALNANAAPLGGTAPSSSPTDLGNSTSELQDLEGFLTEFSNVAGLLGYTGPGTNTTTGAAGGGGGGAGNGNDGSGGSSGGAGSTGTGNNPSTTSSSTSNNAANSPALNQPAPNHTTASVNTTFFLSPNTPHPWTNSNFFNMTLGEVINTFRSPEATARYLFAKGYRPQGVKAGAGSGYQYGANVAGQTWVYTGPRGKAPLPNLKYTIGKTGG